jgi:NAD-dependent DNA ligase
LALPACCNGLRPPQSPGCRFARAAVAVLLSHLRLRLDQQAEAKVVDVLWGASKDGFLKPRVRIEPVHIVGVTIEYVTGYNGKFIEENRIGVGAIIQLIRSGDVIPKIVGVTTPAEKPKMPDVPYIWSENHVDVLLEDATDNEDVLMKNIVGFFVKMGVEGLAAGNVKKIMAAGFTSVKSILNMTPEDFLKVEGFQSKTAAKLHKGIHEKVDAASMIDWMVASNKMGRGLGSRKLQPILAAYPDILVSPLSDGEKIALLQKVEGIGAIQAKTFVENIPVFLAFLEESGYQGKVQKPVSPVITGSIDPLFGKKVAMTGFRDEAIKSALKERGATLEDRVSSDTFALLVKSKEAKQDPSNKVKDAMKKGVPILTAAEFVEAYLS